MATATVGSTGGFDNYASLTPVNVTNPGGTVELFVVFKSTVASPYDLDSMTFIGPGVGTPGSGGGTGPIVGVGSKCVDVNGSSSADGAKIQLRTCSGRTTVLLHERVGTELDAQADGSLLNPNSGKCLDANGASSADGTQLII